MDAYHSSEGIKGLWHAINKGITPPDDTYRCTCMLNAPAFLEATVCLVHMPLVMLHVGSLPSQSKMKASTLSRSFALSSLSAFFTAWA